MTGDATVGSRLSADPGTWSDPAATFTYAWLRCDGNGACTQIDGATDSTYILATDDLGYFAVENPVHVHDLHATVLYLLGIDHKKLTYRYRGRDFRLTDVSGEVVRGILA